MLRCLILVLVLLGDYAHGKTAVTIQRFADKTSNTRCSARKSLKSDIGAELQKELVYVLTYYNRLRVLNSEPSTGAAKPALPQYAIQGALRSFDQCSSATVALEVRVYDATSGALAFNYTSSVNVTGAPFITGAFNSAQFNRSSLGQATHAAMNDLAFRTERALLDRKPIIHMVSKDRNVASTDYEVKVRRRDDP